MASSLTQAASVDFVITTASGEPVEDAVISIHSLQSELNSVDPSVHLTAIMDQRDKQFVPYVLPVRTGTEVSFPNSDDIRHQVYSFSKPKPFQLPLYSGESTQPLLFDKSGSVVLGCNIHDRMVGHIYIVDTGYFAKTDSQGNARISDVSHGEYIPQIWHPRIDGTEERLNNDIIVITNADVTKLYQISLQPEKPTRTLTPLEEKFRALR